MRATTASWSNKVCAEELFRRGLASIKLAIVRRDEELARQAAVQAERDAFESRFPVDTAVPGRMAPPDIMICGDGTVDNDPTIPYVEECDDGNIANGDGCDWRCEAEAP